MNVKTRFPPSPTGYLHIGGLRTALYNWYFAKKHGGSFLLRIEDTDRERYVPGAVESLIRTMERLGLTYGEGPVLKDGNVVEIGNTGPYIQSERLEVYQEYAKQLLEHGIAYRCFCPKDRLESVRRQQEIAKLPKKYDRACLRLGEEEIATKLSASEPHVLRLRVPEGETAFDDIVRGRITIRHEEIDDQVLLKSDGFPTYHLAVVVDDHLMEITHVIRGEEWLSSTPKHIILYKAFGWQQPAFAHLPLILNPDRSKLSKRQGDVAVEDFLDKGYLPETLINFVSLLGFNPRDDQELYSMEEFAESFDLGKVNKGGAVFNREKLDWMNAQYLRRKSDAELSGLIRPYLERAGKGIPSDETLERIVTIEKDRLHTLADLNDRIDGYLALPEFPASLLVWKKSDKADAAIRLSSLRDLLEGMEPETFASRELIEAAVKGYIEDNGLENGNVLWPVRVALSGASQSPGPFDLLWIFRKEESLRRIDHAISLLASI